MIREFAVAQPVSPEPHRGLHVVRRRLLVCGRVPVPGEGDERRLTLPEGGASVAARPDLSQPDAALDLERRVAGRWEHGHRPVVVVVVAPLPGGGPVLEERHAVGDDLDLASDAGRRAHEGPGGRGVRRGPPIAGTPLVDLDGSDDEEVVDDEPSGGGVPRRFEHHGAGQVPALVWDEGAGRPESKLARRPVEQRPEDAGRVRPGKAEPLDRAVRRHQTAVLAVGQEAVVGDRRKCAHWYRSPSDGTTIPQCIFARPNWVRHLTFGGQGRSVPIEGPVIPPHTPLRWPIGVGTLVPGSAIKFRNVRVPLTGLSSDFTPRSPLSPL